MNRCRSILLASLVLFSATSMLLAQGSTTGSLRGRITDPSGQAVPGVTVSATSAAVIGGSLTAVTSDDGVYRFPSLPPGLYEIKMELQGFRIISVPDVRINVGLGLTIDRQMELAAVEEQVTVVGEAPIVDTKNTSADSTWSDTLTENVATPRNYWVTVQQIPGVVRAQEDVGSSSGYSDFQVHGSIAGSHAFNFDGVDLDLQLDRVRGFPAGHSNPDAFEEIQFSTSGISAEHSKGGFIINTVVKSGGNDFHGLVGSYYQSPSLQSDNVDDELRAKGVQSNGAPIDYVYDLTGNLGGPIVKDRVGFFFAVRQYKDKIFVLNCTLPNGAQCDRETTNRNITSKLNWQINPRQRFTLTHDYGLLYIPVRGLSQFTKFEATTVEDYGFHLAQARYEWSIDDRKLLDFQIGHVWPPFPLTYQPEVQGSPTRFDEITRVRSDAANQEFFEEGRLMALRGNFTYFADDIGGTSHDIKTGFEHRRSRQVTRFNRNEGIDRRFRNGVASRVFAYNTPVEQLARSYGLGIYAQDTIRVSQRLTLNLGIRLEDWGGDIPAQSNQPSDFADVFGGGQTFPEQKGVIEWTTISPRLGFVFDVSGDSNTVVKATYGRYYLGIFSRDINEFSNQNGLASAIYDWRDLNANDFPERNEFGQLRSLNLPEKRGVDPDLESPRQDEFTAAVERRLSPSMSFSARYTYRKFNNNLAIDDRALPDSAFNVPTTIVDPLTGRTIDYWSLGPQFGTVTNEFFLTQFDDNYVRYHGLDLILNRRFASGWQLVGSLTIQDNSGRVGGYLDRNDNEIFPFGAADLDARYLVKILGSYTLPHDIRLSAVFRSTGGNNLGRGGVDFPGGNMARILLAPDVTTGSLYELRVEENGSYRQDAYHILDIGVSKAFRTSKGYAVEVLLDGFNITNANNILQAGVITGASYEVPATILRPRIFRVGARFTF